jgi:hypothetical protein
MILYYMLAYSLRMGALTRCYPLLGINQTKPKDIIKLDAIDSSYGPPPEVSYCYSYIMFYVT